MRRAATCDGLYIASEQATGEPLTPTDLYDAVAYVQSERQNHAPLEVAFAGVTEATTAATVIQPYAQAGATWWLEGIWVERGSVQAMRERIRQGPPSIALTRPPD
jgi:hypothetical protein